MSEARPKHCGGCGETDPEKRCIGCLADFGPDLTSEGEAAKPCTCHLDDNPPVPCAQKYALSECLSAPQPAQLDLEVVAWRSRGPRGGWLYREIPYDNGCEPLVTLDAAQKALTAANERAERAERRLEDYQDTHTDDEGNVWHRPTAWSYFAACRALCHAQSRLETDEALNTTLSEALEWYASPEAWTINQVEGPDGDYGHRARTALAALRKSQGEKE